VKLLTTKKIDFDTIFKSDEIINAKLRIKKNGKHRYSIKEVPLSSLVLYEKPCKIFIDQILRKQLSKRNNWYIPIHSKVLDILLGSSKNRTIVEYLLFHVLHIIDINQKANFSGTFKKKFTRSFIINDEYHDELKEIEVDGDLPEYSYNKEIGFYKVTGVRKVDDTSLGVHTVDSVQLSGVHTDSSTTILSDLGVHTDKSTSLLSTNTKPLYASDVCTPLDMCIQFEINNLSKIEFDTNKAIEYLEANKHLLKIRSYNTTKYRIHAVSESKLVKRTLVANKLQSPINQLTKEFRQFITVDGKQLVDIDFCNSHLNQLIKLIRDDIKSGGYVPEFSIQYFSQEMIEFKELVLAGDFYNKLQDKYNKEYPHKPIDRKKAKDAVMYWLNNSYHTLHSVQLLKRIYPQITHYLSTVNGSTRNTISIKSQANEAHLVKEVSLEFINQIPDGVCFTMLDGFLVEEQYKEQLIKIIQIKSKEFLGFVNKIKIKELPKFNSNNPSIQNITEHQKNKVEMPIVERIIEPALNTVVQDEGFSTPVESLTDMVRAGKITVEEYSLLDDSILHMPKTLLETSSTFFL